MSVFFKVATPPSASSSNPLPRETVVLAFQIEEFTKAGHAFTRENPEELRQTISAITSTNFRPVSVLPSRTRQSRASSVDELGYPFQWATDKGEYLKVI